MNRIVIAVVILALAASPILAADGAALFKSKCAACHGPDGKGETPVGKTLKVASLGSAEVQKLSDADLEKAISDGKGKMPAFKGKLAADELKAVVAFVRTLKGK